MCCVPGHDVLLLVYRFIASVLISMSFMISVTPVVDPPMVIYMGKDKHESECFTVVVLHSQPNTTHENSTFAPPL